MTQLIYCSTHTLTQVCSKVTSYLAQGLDNLSWRFWHLQNIIIKSDNAKSKHEFNKLFKAMGDKLDKVSELTLIFLPPFSRLNKIYYAFISRNFALNPSYSSSDTPALVVVSVPVVARSSFWRYPQPHALLSHARLHCPAFRPFLHPHFLPHRIRITNALA